MKSRTLPQNKLRSGTREKQQQVASQNRRDRFNSHGLVEKQFFIKEENYELLMSICQNLEGIHPSGLKRGTKTETVGRVMDTILENFHNQPALFLLRNEVSRKLYNMHLKVVHKLAVLKGDFGKVAIEMTNFGHQTPDAITALKDADKSPSDWTVEDVKFISNIKKLRRTIKKLEKVSIGRGRTARQNR